MERLQLEIVTPDSIVLSEEVDYVSLTGFEGEFGVLPGHVPFFAALTVGCMHYIRDNKTWYACITGGFAEVADNKVQVLVDAGEKAEDVDVTRAEAALKRARERLALARQEHNLNTTRAEAALQRAMNRLEAKKRTQ